jgi:hypothetical protein
MILTSVMALVYMRTNALGTSSCQAIVHLFKIWTKIRRLDALVLNVLSILIKIRTDEGGLDAINLMILIKWK